MKEGMTMKVKLTIERKQHVNGFNEPAVWMKEETDFCDSVEAFTADPFNARQIALGNLRIVSVRDCPEAASAMEARAAYFEKYSD
jgi:hypothetical protein